MPSPEQTFQPQIAFAPDNKTSSSSTDLPGLEKTQPINEGDVLSKLRNMQNDTLSEEYFKLVTLGKFLPTLEKLQIVPSIPNNPNPFDPEIEEKRHEEWWDQHPELAQQFSNEVEQRESALHYIYYGAVIGQLLNGLSRKK